MKDTEHHRQIFPRIHLLYYRIHCFQFCVCWFVLFGFSLPYCRIFLRHLSLFVASQCHAETKYQTGRVAMLTVADWTSGSGSMDLSHTVCLCMMFKHMYIVCIVSTSTHAQTAQMYRSTEEHTACWYIGRMGTKPGFQDDVHRSFSWNTHTHTHAPAEESQAPDPRECK